MEAQKKIIDTTAVSGKQPDTQKTPKDWRFAKLKGYEFLYDILKIMSVGIQKGNLLFVGIICSYMQMGIDAIGRWKSIGLVILAGIALYHIFKYVNNILVDFADKFYSNAVFIFQYMNDIDVSKAEKSAPILYAQWKNNSGRSDRKS